MSSTAMVATAMPTTVMTTNLQWRYDIVSQTTHHNIHNLPGHWRVGTHVKSSHVMEVTSFPGSLRTQTKMRKEGESLVKLRQNNDTQTQKDSIYKGFILAVHGFWQVLICNKVISYVKIILGRQPSSSYEHWGKG